MALVKIISIANRWLSTSSSQWSLPFVIFMLANLTVIVIRLFSHFLFAMICPLLLHFPFEVFGMFSNLLLNWRILLLLLLFCVFVFILVLLLFPHILLCFFFILFSLLLICLRYFVDWWEDVRRETDIQLYSITEVKNLQNCIWVVRIWRQFY